jgi:hypothetical protein
MHPARGTLHAERKRVTKSYSIAPTEFLKGWSTVSYESRLQNNTTGIPQVEST